MGLKLIHEFELATSSEKVWSAPVFDPVALDAPRGNLGSTRQGPGGPEEFSRSGPAPTPSAMSEPVRHAISSPVESVVSKSHSLNPLAAGWSSRLPTSSISSAPQPSHAGQNESKVEDLVGTVASALDVGFNIPIAEILTFNGDPLECCQFIHNFDVNIASLISDPRKRSFSIVGVKPNKLRTAACTSQNVVIRKLGRSCIINLEDLTLLLKPM